MPEKTAAPQLQSEEKNCIVPTDDKALRLSIIFYGKPYTKGDDVSHQTTVRFSCSPNHVFRGNDINYCDNGKWKSPWPKCVKVCNRNTIVNDPKITAICRYQEKVVDCASDPIVVSTVAEVSCAPGYVPYGNVTKAVRICNSEGEWKRLNTKLPSKRFDCKPDCGKTFSTVQGYPWLVSIYHHISRRNYGFNCLGAIIDPFFVLTTASCFSPSPFPESALVVLGNHSVDFNLWEEHGLDTSNIASIEVDEL